MALSAVPTLPAAAEPAEPAAAARRAGDDYEEDEEGGRRRKTRGAAAEKTTAITATAAGATATGRAAATAGAGAAARTPATTPRLDLRGGTAVAATAAATAKAAKALATARATATTPAPRSALATTAAATTGATSTAGTAAHKEAAAITARAATALRAEATATVMSRTVRVATAATPSTLGAPAAAAAVATTAAYIQTAAAETASKSATKKKQLSPLSMPLDAWKYVAVGATKSLRKERNIRQLAVGMLLLKKHVKQQRHQEQQRQRQQMLQNYLDVFFAHQQDGQSREQQQRKELGEQLKKMQQEEKKEKHPQEGHLQRTQALSSSLPLPYQQETDDHQKACTCWQQQQQPSEERLLQEEDHWEIDRYWQQQQQHSFRHSLSIYTQHGVPQQHRQQQSFIAAAWVLILTCVWTIAMEQNIIAAAISFNTAAEGKIFSQNACNSHSSINISPSFASVAAAVPCLVPISKLHVSQRLFAPHRRYSYPSPQQQQQPGQQQPWQQRYTLFVSSSPQEERLYVTTGKDIIRHTKTAEAFSSSLPESHVVILSVLDSSPGHEANTAPYHAAATGVTPAGGLSAVTGFVVPPSLGSTRGTAMQRGVRTPRETPASTDVEAFKAGQICLAPEFQLQRKQLIAYYGVRTPRVSLHHQDKTRSAAAVAFSSPRRHLQAADTPSHHVPCFISSFIPRHGQSLLSSVDAHTSLASSAAVLSDTSCISRKTAGAPLFPATASQPASRTAALSRVRAPISHDLAALSHAGAAATTSSSSSHSNSSSSRHHPLGGARGALEGVAPRAPAGAISSTPVAMHQPADAPPSHALAALHHSAAGAAAVVPDAARAATIHRAAAAAHLETPGNAATARFFSHNNDDDASLVARSEESKEPTNNEAEVFHFQAEVKRVLDIIVNSLYTDRDVFLRELISNAADACDKKRVLLQQRLPQQQHQHQHKQQQRRQGEKVFRGSIRVRADREKNTLSIEDDGIGMTREELINNLGTIAQSGTYRFLEQLQKEKKASAASSPITGNKQHMDDDASLIGQFGVGFYSAFLVANKVEVYSAAWTRKKKKKRETATAGTEEGQGRNPEKTEEEEAEKKTTAATAAAADVVKAIGTGQGAPGEQTTVFHIPADGKKDVPAVEEEKIQMWKWSSTCGQTFQLEQIPDAAAERQRWLQEAKDLRAHFRKERQQQQQRQQEQQQQQQQQLGVQPQQQEQEGRVSSQGELGGEEKEEEEELKENWSGTRVVLHLKEDCDDYLEDYKLKELLRKYSEFVQLPIYIWSERIEYERVPDTDGLPPLPVQPQQQQISSSLARGEDGKKLKTTGPPSPFVSPVTPETMDEQLERMQQQQQRMTGQTAAATGSGSRFKTVTRRHYEWEHLNTQPPIWRRDETTLSDKDYVDFYKSTFKAYDDPLSFIHTNVEGQVSFNALLFVPGALPWELARNMFDEDSRGIRLYVKRVFINDKFADAVPRWLTFIRGVVDSDELPLNVGREILQKSRMLQVINKRLAMKAVEMIKKLKGDGGEKWRRFWENYGKYIKVGAVEDKDNQEELASLVQFHSTASPQALTDLSSYINRLQARNAAIQRGEAVLTERGGSKGTTEGRLLQPRKQQAIYYLAAENRRAAEESPALELPKALGYEVIFGTEPLDEFFLASLSINQYKGYQVVDVNKADLKLGTEKAEDAAAATAAAMRDEAGKPPREGMGHTQSSQREGLAELDNIETKRIQLGSDCEAQVKKDVKMPDLHVYSDLSFSAEVRVEYFPLVADDGLSPCDMCVGIGDRASPMPAVALVKKKSNTILFPGAQEKLHTLAPIPILKIRAYEEDALLIRRCMMNVPTLIVCSTVLVQGDFGLSPTMQRYMKQQAAAQGVSEHELYGASLNQPILELNPYHPIVQRLDMLVRCDVTDPKAKEVALQLFDVASLQGGYTIENPGQFAKRIVDMMKKDADAALSKQQQKHHEEKTNEQGKVTPSPTLNDVAVERPSHSDHT